MKPICKILYFLLISIAIAGHAQKPIYKHITSENGLANDITYQIIQDSKGYIWIGTNDGLSKYDGKKFTNYINNGFRSNYVIDITEDIENNQFLIATWAGGLHFLRNDSIYSFQNKKDHTSKINRVYKYNDSIIIGRSVGTPTFNIYNLKDSSLTRLRLTDPLSKNKDFLSLSSFYSNLSTYSFDETYINNNFYIYKSHKEDKNLLNNIGVYTLKNLSKAKKLDIDKLNNSFVHYFYKNKNTSIAASFDNIYIYENEKLKFHKNLNIGPGKILHLVKENQKIYFVFNSKKDNLRELYKYDLTTQLLTNISKQLKIKNPISDLLIDADKNLWITTYGQGVYQILNTENTFLDAEVFENPDLRDLAIVKDEVFTLSYSLLYSVTTKGVFSKKLPMYTESFQIDNDTIKLITPSGNEKGYNSVFNNRKISNKTNESFFFKVDSLKIILDHSHYHISNTYKTLRGSIKNNVEHYIKKALLHKDQILINYGRLGIYSLNLKNWELTKWNRTKDLKINIVNDLLKDHDTIWIASNLGAYKITPQKTIHYTTDDGLSSNHVNHLLIDSHHRLWAGTQKGLNVLYNQHFYSIDKSLGQQSITIKKIVEKDNYLYVAGNKGLFIMDNTTPFKTASNTELIVQQQNNSFKLYTINYINSPSIVIAYQLNYKGWTTTTNNELDFNNLKQGKYTIKFRYKDNLSNWKYTKSYSFEIKLPWNQQTWFYVTITFLLLSGFIILLWRGLNRSIKKNETLKNTIEEKEELETALKEVRKNVARDFHDELGNKLASIAITSSLLIDTDYKSDTAIQKKKLHQIKKDADYLYSGMKDFVWSLDHKNDDLRHLQIYLNDFGEQLFSFSNISFYSTHNFTEQKTILPYYWSKQLVLIFKEAMTNTLKHSEATKVLLKFTLKGNKLKIMLKDDGNGFNIDTLQRINGIQNMKYRAKTLHQKLIIDTTNGTTITFIGNLKKNTNEQA